MKYERISIRYAKALYDLALEMNTDKAVFDDMLIVEDICRYKELTVIINSPVIKATKKIAIINALLKDRISELSLKYLLLIIRKQRENLFQNIAIQYISIYREKNNIKVAKFVSAAPITDVLKSEIKNTIQTLLNCKTELFADVKSSLIGGFVVTVDGKRYDASIKNKLDRLTKEFKTNIYEKGF